MSTYAILSATGQDWKLDTAGPHCRTAPDPYVFVHFRQKLERLTSKSTSSSSSASSSNKNVTVFKGIITDIPPADRLHLRHQRHLPHSRSPTRIAQEQARSVPGW